MTAPPVEEMSHTNEQWAQIGRAMVHFRHRLQNLTGATQSHLDLLEAAFRHGDPDGCTRAISALRENTRDIANAFHRAMGFVKEPEMQAVPVIELVRKVQGQLDRGLSRVVLEIAVPQGLLAETDPEIASLVLGTLLDNAVQAMAGSEKPAISIQAERKGEHIALRVADNGTGVPENMYNRLFKFGFTTKGQGLGCALALARTRMEQMRGNLIFPMPQPTIGAEFEILLAISSAEGDTP